MTCSPLRVSAALGVKLPAGGPFLAPHVETVDVQSGYELLWAAVL
jgi:hypothetical protein